ncbi:universal stress protein [Mucilaginibacter sp.]|uniref:universal stress protein n=1 Tax=Mucilaginibacter sp. TaxID=1882438 RepID=UPI003D0A61BC
MKTILVLTDFSINATYTAQYALELAQKTKANLLFCNVYTIPANERPDEPKAWPIAEAEESSIQDLSAMVYQLKDELDKEEDTQCFRPDIEQYNGEGSIADRIKDISNKYQVILVIISKHSTIHTSALFANNHARAIIESAGFPVLVIPYQVRFKPYKTIAFATAMNYSDIDVLQSLCGLAEHSKSKILITHIVSRNTENESTVKKFFSQIPMKINYPGIIYRVIKSNSVIDSLKQLMLNTEIDLLVMVHCKTTFLRRLFNSSIAQRLALYSGKPLLIFPCAQVRQVLPVF